MLHERHMEWVEARGIDCELAVSLGLSTNKDGAGFWLSVPYRQNGTTVNHKHRMTTEKRHRMDTGAPLIWWNIDCLKDPRAHSSSHPVVITEGEWDAMAAMQAGFPLVLSVPNGAPPKATPEGPISADNDAERFAFLHRARSDTDNVAVFILATDNDAPGEVLRYELVRRLGAERCKFVTYPDGCKDLNDVLLAHGKAGISEVLNAAKPYPVKGLGRIDDFPDAPPVEPIRVRIPELQKMLPIVPGTFCVVTGYAGQGKTSVIMAIVADVLRQGHNVALASFETAIKPILQNKLRAHLLGCSDKEVVGANTSEPDRLLHQRLGVIAQLPSDDDADMTLDDVLELAAVAVLRDGIELLVIDPWNEVEHKRGRDETETDYTGRAIRMMKRFARQYQVALWLVAHPRKPVMDRGSVKAPTLYDISGSANFANKADFGVVIHRPKRDSNLVDIHVTKVRMGLPGCMGNVRLAWNWQKSRYEVPPKSDAEELLE